jgi:hypothetical protein
MLYNGVMSKENNTIDHTTVDQSPIDNTANETLLEFPCEFPIKAMGLNEDGFDLLVVEIVQKHIIVLSEDAVKSRSSSNSKYLSVTVTVIAVSKKQLDDIYTDLSGHDRVLMAL